MNLVKYTTYIFLSIIISVSLFSFFYGITHREAVSVDYTIPHILAYVTGDFLHVPSGDPYLYFPASSSLITVPFFLLGFPNLFGLLGFLFLFFVCKKLGDTFKLTPYMSVIFASSFVTTISVIRTVSDQSVDKWLAIWFIISLILLEKPKTKIIYSLLLGLSLGMLVGTKYSGPLFFLALVPLYFEQIIRNTNALRLIVMTIAFSIAGLFWYFRNFALTANPYYPANVGILKKGAPGFTQQDWMLLRIPFEYPEGLIPLFNSYLSEFMIWTFSIVIILWFIVHSIRNKIKIGRQFKKVFILILTTGIVCLFLPITPPEKIELFHIISDMRYVYIFTVLTMLAVFMIAEKYKKNETLSFVAIVNVIPMFSFIPYQIKVFIMSTFITTFLLVRHNKFVNKIITKF